MNKVLISVVFFIAFALAGSHQNGNLTVMTLTNGVYSGTLPITTVENNYNVQLFKIWVPSNATNVTVTFANTNTADCTYVHLFLRSFGLPCSYHDYSSDYMCTGAADPGNGIGGTPQTIVAYPGYSNDLYEFAVNQYHYIGIGRYSTYNEDACTYTLTTNVQAGCLPNQVAVYSSSTSQTCVNVTPLTTGSVNFTASTMYKLTVPEATGHIYIFINSTSSDLDFYGANYYGPSSNQYSCSRTTYDTSNNGMYQYNLFCYTPRSGDFYLNILDDGSNSTMTVNINTCGSGMGGYNCSFNATALNFTALTGSGISVNVPADIGGQFLDDGFSYFYIDVPSNLVYNKEVTLNAVSSTAGYMYFRRGGFNEDSSTYGYESSDEYDSYPATFSINNFEYGVQGRIYFGLDCTSSTTNCVVTLSANVTVPAVVTTGVFDLTTSQMSVAYYATPVFAMIFAFVASLF